jgi:serine phosphatase RsbU (regulator of sigma subunit)
MPVDRAKSFFDDYTRDLTSSDFQRLFTRDTAEAYRYFTRHHDPRKLEGKPWYQRWLIHIRIIFIGFTMRLSPARRALYGLALLAAVYGTIRWSTGPFWLLVAFGAVNLLILMEVADRLSLKGDLEIARDIQLAMLPGGVQVAGDTSVCGVTRPANTVGGDFFDIIPIAGGRMVITIGDVAGKGSPAALLMALLLAMLRTLVDEGLETARLVERLNAQVAKHSPASRFITLFFAVYDPATGVIQFVNAGHLPPLIRRNDGTFERITGNTGSGLALGMFEGAKYATNQITVNPGDVLLMYTDGITEAENGTGQAFEDAGLESALESVWQQDSLEIGRGIQQAVERFAGDVRLADDLTTLTLKRAAAGATV